MDSATGTVLILLAGICVVVGGVLLLRLHAFLALILAALLVAALTPQEALERYLIEQAGVEVVSASETEIRIETPNGPPLLQGKQIDGIRPGELFILLRRQQGASRYQGIADLKVQHLEPTPDGKRTEAVLTVTEGPSPSYAAGDVIIHPLDLKQARKSAEATIGARVAAGFGATCVKIGILIAMAAIIGKCLLDSGAADCVVRSMLRWFGEAGAPLAFLFSGFLLGVPVFFDTVFYLMIPLGKAMRMRTGRNYLLFVLTIVCGATMAHSLVPPTPGPLFVAEELQVNIGTMILGGSIVGLLTAATGYLYAVFANRRWDLPLRESPDFSLTELESAIQADSQDLPPFWLAILPVILPVLLIAGLTILQRLPLWSGMPDMLKRVLMTLGDKNLALVLSALIAMGTLILQKRTSLTALAESIQKALASGGVIILITAAGGAFGSVLRQTGVASLISHLSSSSPVMICTMAFLITTAIRTAQGSATVAMITSVGILSGIASQGLPFHPLYLALAIGCGSKPVAWMNDSGFWVITKMSGMTEAEGLKYVTPMTTSMGLVGLAAVLVGVSLWPQF